MYQVPEAAPPLQPAASAYPATPTGLDTPKPANLKEEIIQSPEPKKARISEAGIIDVEAEFPDTPPATERQISANIELLDDDVDEDEEDVFGHGNVV
jgi:hypothetical protein